MVAKVIFRLCFALLFIPVLALCFWLPLIYMAVGSAIPSILLYWVVLLGVEIVSLALYFRWPWIAVLVGWIDIAVILSGIIPWRSHAVYSFIQQFGFDLLFLGIAHVGPVASLFGGSSKLKWRVESAGQV
jgi:hypothetical protein